MIYLITSVYSSGNDTTVPTSEQSVRNNVK